MNTLRPFHLAVPVNELEPAREFYRNVLGCTEGRSSDQWVDFNFWGHQFVIHERKASQKTQSVKNNVDGKQVPVFHFGIVLEWSEWQSLSKRLKEQSVEFEIEPYVRFEGEEGEQATMFFRDPSGNAIEMKSFKEDSMLFEPFTSSK